MPTVTIPDATYHALAARAAALNTTVDGLAAMLLAEADTIDAMIDHEFHAECAAEEAADPSPVPTLEEVHAALSSIPGNLSDDIYAERDER